MVIDSFLINTRLLQYIIIPKYSDYMHQDDGFKHEGFPHVQKRNLLQIYFKNLRVSIYLFYTRLGGFLFHNMT
jgi:hypothetical protein